MINDILYASIFNLFYNFIFANSISTIFSKIFSISNKSYKFIYFSTLGFGTITIIGYGFNSFRKKIGILDRKYYPISRFIKFKALGIDYSKINH